MMVPAPSLSVTTPRRNPTSGVHRDELAQRILLALSVLGHFPDDDAYVTQACKVLRGDVVL